MTASKVYHHSAPFHQQSSLTRAGVQQAQDLNRVSPSHRLSMSSVASTAYSQRMHPRAQSHSHSLSVGSINPAHRVSRRKSTSSSAANRDAVMAALSHTAAESSSLASRRVSKTVTGSRHTPSFPASLPSASVFPTSFEGMRSSGSAVTDGPSLATLPETDKPHGKTRTRRASEGSRLSKGEGKRTTSELRCEKCGKGYKHSSCLTKHLWEHTPEWQYTSKLLISKHQQVQLLEAASVLVAMNQEASAAVESDSSPSPAASGSSETHEEELMSSADTTPPPQPHESASSLGQRSATRSEFGHASKRYSGNSSTYSQSYQSSVFSESAPSVSRPYMSHYRQWSMDGRPTTSGTSVSGSYKDQTESQEHADLAAAVGLLSCSYGTPKTGPVMLPADAPPVPPLPAQFLGQKAETLSDSTMTITGPSQSYSYLRERKENVDVDMDYDDDDDMDHHRATRGRSDDDDEGMFGKMEE